MRHAIVMVVGLLVAMYNMVVRFVRLANPIRVGKHKRVEFVAPPQFTKLRPVEPRPPKKVRTTLIAFTVQGSRKAMFQTRAGGILVARIVGSDGNGCLYLRRDNDAPFRRPVIAVA